MPYRSRMNKRRFKSRSKRRFSRSLRRRASMRVPRLIPDGIVKEKISIVVRAFSGKAADLNTKSQFVVKWYPLGDVTPAESFIYPNKVNYPKDYVYTTELQQWVSLAAIHE